MNPLATLRLCLAVAYLCSLAVCYWGGHHNGFKEADTANQLVIAQLNEKARADEQAHTAAVTDLAYQLQKANHDADIQTSKLRDALRTGAQRLYVPAACPIQAPASAAAPTGDRFETRAELDPATAEALVAITDDGDRAIRQLNACIDAYNDLTTKR